MGDTQSVILNARILPETRDKIREISKLTFRGIGDTLDWVVSDAYEKITKVRQSDQTLAEAISEPVN